MRILWRRTARRSAVLWSTGSRDLGCRTSRNAVGSAGRSEVRILFVFDPKRQVVLLVAGDKARNWSAWYETSVPVAEARYDLWLGGHYEQEI